MTRSVWRYRCERVHGKEKKRQYKRERRILRQEIALQYQLGDNDVRASEKDLLTVPQSKVRKYSIRAQKYWIATLKASRKYMKEMNTNMLAGMRDVLRRWAFVPD